MWIQHQLSDESGIYNNHFVWEIPKDTNIDILKTCLNEVTQRHVALRATYSYENDEPYFIDQETSVAYLEETNIGDLKDDALEKLLDKELLKPFNLKKEPVVRWKLFYRNSLPPIFGLFMQHTNIDLWSCMIVLNEIRTVYNALVKNEKPEFELLKKNLIDYNLWQREYVKTEQGLADKVFWDHELKDFDFSLDFPTDFQRPNKLGCIGSYFQFPLNEASTNDLSRLASEHKISLFALYLGIFHLLIYKLSNQPNVCIGTATGGRTKEYEKVFGYLSNTILVCLEHDPALTFIEYIKKVDLKVKELLQHQLYPLAQIASELDTDRDQSRAPLFQFTFVWENINRFENRDKSMVELNENLDQDWDFGEAGTWNRITRKQQLDDFDIVFRVNKFQNRFLGAIDYNTELFSKETIEELGVKYQNLMKKTASEPHRKISDISLLSQQEYNKTIFDWNKTSHTYDKSLSFVDLFENKTNEFPNTIAIQTNNFTLTYSVLNKEANQLASLLVSRGVKPETIVGISLDRSPKMIISLLAILKAGGAYLPLDPDYPKERLEYMIKDSKVPFVITSKEQRDVYSNIKTNILYLDELKSEISSFQIENLPKRIKHNNLAYVIYTSGSTGKPKGVQIEHTSLMNLTVTQNHVYRLNEDDNVLLFSSLNFDASIFAITSALCSGSSLHIASKEQLLGDSLSNFLNDKRISWVLLPPSIASTLSPKALPNLKTLIVGGEACGQSFAKEWSDGRTLINAYGPTESTVWASYCILDGTIPPPIGKPVANTQTYILDANLKPVPTGVSGELHIGGDGLARGYLNQPELTAEKFIPNPFSQDKSSRLYKSGDLARYLPDGKIEFLGRLDHQIKIRGFRVELGEIEETLITHPKVKEALVMARNDMTGKPNGEPLLAAYIITNDTQLEIRELKELLKTQLPDYMVPSGFVLLDAFPLTPNEKIDRKALPIPELGNGKKTGKQQLPRNEIEKIIAGIWQEVLNLSNVSTDENFFDLGGHSLLLAQVHSKFPKNLKAKLSMVDLFKYPTIHALTHYLEIDDEEEDAFFLQQDEHIERMRLRRRILENIRGLKIAIVGMSGRFPGAENVDEFWQNIINKKESIRFYSKEELLKAGVPKNLVNDPNYVPAKGAIKNSKGFDAAFFGYTPREAQITDPQHRLFLECAHEALEDAACVPDKFKGQIGVYAGTGINNYLTNHISAHQSLVNAVGDYPVMIGNDKDFLSNRVSYKLNLNGPAMVIQTACSTSLVAIHTACQALINDECDAALAGGVSLGKLDDEGYLYKEGMIMSPDGHCRPFDEKAKGTLLGQGAGVVLLKRLDDALQDNDHIYAVIKGSGINNDGAAKSGYTAPSIEGQAKAVMLAHASANVSPQQISYIEAHGTGTPIGDPIEIEGLNYAFRHSANMHRTDTNTTREENISEASSSTTHHCAIGSVKSNIGHMDAASGVTGLIKTAKALEQSILPPSLHFETANPKINFGRTPFYVNTQTTPWPNQVGPRHAGVSSFGIGGTNAHIVLSEAPDQTVSGRSRPWQIITLSAKTETALETMTAQLHDYLNTHPNVSFSDVCYTLHLGRKLFEHRRFLVCKNTDDAIFELSKILPNETSQKQSGRVITKADTKTPRKIAFMFSGQGSQYVNMAQKLYKVELNFRKEIDRCRNILKERFVYLFERLVEDDFNALSDKVHDTYITQPTLFITEYALAKTLMSWNIQPEVMIGHSIGEYAAACLAGVFTLEQALELVTIRGRMIYDLEKGDMLMVELSEQEANTYLNESLSLAAINGEYRCVISGQSEAIITLQKELTKNEVQNRILHTSHAFHSHMMDEILEDFTNSVRRRSPQKPTIPFISSLTGELITDHQATSPKYWARHLRNAVRFHQGLETLFNRRENDKSGWILLEIGPGKMLSTLARQHPIKTDKDVVYETMRHSYEDVSDIKKLLTTIAKLWMNNVDIDWEVFHSYRQRYKRSLPTYPFERLDYWIESANKIRLTQDRRGRGQDTLPALPNEQVPIKILKKSIIKPRDKFDLFICELWEKSLGINKVCIHDNYFDLGGDSLRAVGIIDKLVTKYNTPIATHILIQKPTIAELSDYIKSITQHPEAKGAQDNEQAYTLSLVTIQKGSERKQPLFMVHPIGGEVYFYRDLAHQLGADQPLFAFQATSLSGQSEPYDDVKTMAMDYISELKAIGATPPYLLGGSSFGGLVAYEMAQQLKALGEEVRLLVMIDTPFPQEMPAHLTNSTAILEYLLKDKIPLDTKILNKLEPKAQIDYVLEEARLRGKSDVIPPHLGVPLFNTWIAHQKATFDYHPKPYTDDMVFFRHTERMAHFPAAPHETWLNYVEGKVEIHQVPGDHISMNFQPCVSVLAAHLKIVLKNTTAQIQRDLDNAEENKLYPQSYSLTA
jgi:amino acid adenylation domain-containing protein